jgi:phosphohistidine swiveling domain-containing protein
VSPSQEQSSDGAVLREALRLRVRWVQELMGRAAWLLGLRLARAGALTSAEQVRALALNELHAIVTTRATPVPALLDGRLEVVTAPLPACFQISDRGRAIAVRRGAERGGGTGAGGGVGVGTVTHDISDPAPGSVLVTTTLSPGLAPLLPRLRGIVADTGSVLAHLAILARESHVAIVVGYVGASDDLADGTLVRVDGSAGEVTVVDEGKDT